MRWILLLFAVAGVALALWLRSAPESGGPALGDDGPDIAELAPSGTARPRGVVDVDGTRLLFASAAGASGPRSMQQNSARSRARTELARTLVMVTKGWLAELANAAPDLAAGATDGELPFARDLVNALVEARLAESRQIDALGDDALTVFFGVALDAVIDDYESRLAVALADGPGADVLADHSESIRELRPADFERYWR